MNFYVSMIFLGIILVVISMVGILYDKKRSIDFESRIEEKKRELYSIINDAEMMIEEINKFSDYVVSQMETKNQELYTTLQSIDQKLKQLNIGECAKNSNNSINAENIEPKEKNAACIVGKPPQSSDYNEKVIPISSKHKEIIKLSQNGMDETQIAKRMNMGKGEIRLILEMHK